MKKSLGVLCSLKLNSGVIKRNEAEMNRTGLGTQKITANGRRSMRELWCVLLVAVLLAVPASVWSADWSSLADTGQVTCYDIDGAEILCPAAGQFLYGQDAHYQEVPPAYMDNSNKTVTDRQSGLVWMNSSEGISRTWQGAIVYCNELVFAGQSDWRLPTKFELESIVDYGRSYPAINQVFNCQRSFYWSATPHVGNPAYAWSVFCDDGADHWVHKTNNYYVRCVRTE